MKAIKSFTLVELVMSVVVLSIISLPLSLLICRYVSSAYSGHSKMYAVNLARREAEVVCNIGFNSLGEGVSLFSQYEGFPYDIRRTVSYKEGGALSDESLKKIELEVFPEGETTGRLAEVTMYRAKNVSF